MKKADLELLVKKALEGDKESQNQLSIVVIGMNDFLLDLVPVLNKMAVNDHTATLTGKYHGLSKEAAVALNSVRDRLLHITGSIEKISVGDGSDYEEYKKIGRRSDQDHIVPAFIRCLGALNAMIADANTLAKAGVDGNLSVRADVSKHEGEYRKIIEGVNATLDAVIQPLNEAMRVSEAYSSADFSARFDENIHVAGDFIRFKNGLNYVGIEVSKAITLINNQVTELMASAEEAQASLEELSSGSEQIARNAQSVNDNAMKGSQGIDQVSKVMGDLSAAVEEVASSMESVAQLAKETNKLSTEGAGLANKADQSMIAIGESAKVVDVNINEINARMNEIGKIVGLIRDLANQTNLLALNAAIEAARAGEAGRGFAVVAAEVKSLAQESRGSAENIASMIGDLQERSKKATEAVNLATVQVEQGGKDVAEALKSFNQIVSSIGKISSSTDEVSRAAEQQAASVEEISASVIEVSGLVEGAAKEASNAAAITEEASASIMEINKVVENVNAIAARVSQEMDKFRV